MVNGTNNGSSNGVHPEVATVSELDLLWDSLPLAVVQELAKPLDAGLVSHRKGRNGRTYAYVEGRTVIDQANRIFGFGGWGYELVGEVKLRKIENTDPNTGEVKLIRSYAATVPVAGAPSRTDVGFHTVVEEIGEGHETAYKGAVTDGLKRALRGFGAQFGNELHGDGVAEALAPSLRKTLVDLGVAQGFDEAQVRVAVRSKTGRDLDDIRTSELTGLVEGAAAKLRQAGDAAARPQQAEDTETRKAA